MTDNGKGDKRRPMEVGKDIFEHNWESTFNGKSEDKNRTIEGDESQSESLNSTNGTEEARFIALGNGQFVRCDGLYWHNIARIILGINTEGHTS